MLAADWRAEMLSSKPTTSEFGSIESTDAGLKLITKDKPEHVYDLQLRALNQVAIKAGDIMLIRFAARSVKAEAATGATRLRVGFNRSSPPWTGAERSELGLSHDWQRFDLPFKCPVDFNVKEAQFAVAFGFTPQQCELADVSVLKFPTGTPLSSLPKTKVYANEVSEAVLSREMARIARLRADLDAVKDPSPAHGKTIHVATTGTKAGTGDPEKPFATIPQALEIAEPGDTVVVEAGEYREPHGIAVKKSGRPDAWIKIKAAPGARPKILTSDWEGFGLKFGIGYVEIEGFEMQFVKDDSIKAHGVGIAPAYASHHIRILDNVIHDYGTGGICSLDCDYLYIEGNTIFHTAHTSPYGGSGISLCRSFNFDDNPGYHNVVRRNVSYDNENKVIVQVESGGTGHTLTDGNGIIIDVFKRSRRNSIISHQLDKDGPIEPYRGRTLVENNLCFNNGGRGVHIFRSEKVDVINNTCYMNQKTPEINGGEFTAIEASDVVIANNIGVSRDGKRVSGQDGSTGLIVWTHDLLFGLDALIHNDGIFDKDPMFVAPSPNATAVDFRLQTASPARARGIGRIAPPDDLTGSKRPNDETADLGAFQN